MLIVFRCFIGFPLLYSVIGPELAPPFNQSDSKFACTNHNSVDAAFSASGGQLGFTLRSHRPFMFCLSFDFVFVIAFLLVSRHSVGKRSIDQLVLDIIDFH